MTGDAVRAVAARVAAGNAEKGKKQAAGAEVRRVAETTAAGSGAVGRGGSGRGGRGGPGGHIAWKAVVAEKTLQHQGEVAALQARIRELEAESAARGGGGKTPAADGE